MRVTKRQEEKKLKDKNSNGLVKLLFLPARLIIRLSSFGFDSDLSNSSRYPQIVRQQCCVKTTNQLNFRSKFFHIIGLRVLYEGRDRKKKKDRWLPILTIYHNWKNIKILKPTSFTGEHHVWCLWKGFSKPCFGAGREGTREWLVPNRDPGCTLLPIQWIWGGSLGVTGAGGSTPLGINKPFSSLSWGAPGESTNH